MAKGRPGPPWVTATSYGAVVTSISPDRRLIRMYLNETAASALERGGNATVDLMLRERGVDPDQLDIDRYRAERIECAALVRANGWKLFALHPMMLSIQTIEVCNARCSFCYASAPGTVSRDRMAPTDVYRLKDYAAEHGVKFGISGGEPLLHPSVFDLLAYRGDEVFETLITNFTAKVDLDRLADTHVDLIQVSIHGQGQAHDETLQIRNAYAKVLDRIRTMRPRLNFATNTVITPTNIHTIEPLVRDLAGIQDDTGLDLIYVRMVPVLPSGTGFSSYRTTEEFMASVKALLRRLRATYADVTFETPMLHPNPYEYFEDGEHWVCPAGSAIGVVRMDGAAVPCNQFLDTDLGSYSDVWGSFHDVWIGDPALSRMRGGVPDGPAAPSCEGCAYMTLKERSALSPRGSAHRNSCGDDADGTTQSVELLRRVAVHE